jgi:hypothetical protein
MRKTVGLQATLTCINILARPVAVEECLQEAACRREPAEESSRTSRLGQLWLSFCGMQTAIQHPAVSHSYSKILCAHLQISGCVLFQ